MQALATFIEEAAATDGYDLEEAILGVGTADEVAASLATFVASSLASIDHVLFYRRSTGLVIGLLLSDGQEVLKLHRWKVSIERPLPCKRCSCALPWPAYLHLSRSFLHSLSELASPPSMS